MIEYKKHTLPNGLTIIAHRDNVSEMAAVNMLYKVGARNEDPARTGFAHLFEHLMFRGTKDIPDFDSPVQLACGESNAFTTNDYTNFYITMPRDNVETALWLESDRMEGLRIDQRSLSAEKKVVIEEFNQRYLNQPYGDQWMLLRSMAYRVHPYRWATIGMTPEHIEKATLADVKAFYHKYYQPGNAVLAIAANVEPDRVFEMAERWFGDIPSGEVPSDVIPVEPEQTSARRLEVRRAVPSDAITIAFPMGRRKNREFYLCDLLSDILAGGTSGRLYQALVKERKIFGNVNAYITGDLDPGLFVVTASLMPGVTPGEGEEALWEELRKTQGEPVTDYEMEKVKNKFEAVTIYGELNVMNKALNLAFYDMLGDLELVNGEVAIYGSITPAEVMAAARKIFRPERSSTLIYIADNEEAAQRADEK